MTSDVSPEAGAQPGARALAALKALRAQGSCQPARGASASPAGRNARPNEPEKRRRNRDLTFVAFHISLRFASCVEVSSGPSAATRSGEAGGLPTVSSPIPPDRTGAAVAWRNHEEVELGQKQEEGCRPAGVRK